MNTSTNALRRHRLTVTEYFRMGEHGILAPDARVELINGEIIDMTPINSPHSGTVNQLNTLLVRAAGDRAVISVQNPIILGEYSAPQPDLCLLKPRADHYKRAHPEAGDVLLAIEVADTSLSYDRNTKSRLYAQFGIAEMWLIDVNSGQLWRYCNVDNESYAEVKVLDPSNTIEPLALPDCSIQIASLFD